MGTAKNFHVRCRLLDQLQRTVRGNLVKHLSKIFFVLRYRVATRHVKMDAAGCVSNLLHQVGISSRPEADGRNRISQARRTTGLTEGIRTGIGGVIRCIGYTVGHQHDQLGGTDAGMVLQFVDRFP